MAQPRRQRRTRDKAQVGPPSRLLDFTALGLPELSAKPRRRPAPVSPDAFVGIANPAPLQAEPADLPTPLSQRLVRVTGAAPKRLTLTPSRDYEGLFELPSGLAVQEGIPGRTGTVERMKPSRAKRSPGRKTARVVEGYAPPWATLGINPAAVFEPPPLDRKLPDGRRIRLHQDITVYGDDNRVNIYPNTYPERCVCRITVFVKRVPDGPWIQTGRATGFIAGRRVMVTSGHARPPKPYAGWMIQVVPASYDGSSVYGLTTYASDYKAYQSDAGNDFMACRLYDPVGDTTGWFGAISYDDDWEDWEVWSMSGYPFDKGENRPMMQRSIAVVDDDDGDDIDLDGSDYDTTQVESRADSASGSSGSPMYSWFDNGQMYAIGAHMGQEVDPEFLGSDAHSTAAGGDGFVELIKWARNHWP